MPYCLQANLVNDRPLSLVDLDTFPSPILGVMFNCFFVSNHKVVSLPDDQMEIDQIPSCTRFQTGIAENVLSRLVLPH